MPDASKYTFRLVAEADFSILRHWRMAEHVRRWWGDDEQPDADWLADQRVNRWIVSTKARAFAYMQDYAVHGWADHPFAYLPRNARGVDQYIGPIEMTGQGHGPRFVQARVQHLFGEGVPVVATDPHPDNAAAIRAYQKAGFVISGDPQKTELGMILPMLAWP